MMEPPDALALGLFTNRFAAIAREMGEMLRRTALSTNVKERLDFSCALLDPEGRLVVNAPHIPVHLGALGLCVRKVREVLDLAPGEAAVTNHPAFGGSHLPDVTVITPVFERIARAGESTGQRCEPALLGYVASRAHHSEIGGVRPGSMPPSATSLAEEGVVLEPFHLVRAGQAQWPEVRRRLAARPWPSRAIEENIADLAAALAANNRGATALAALAADHGRETLEQQMGALARLAGDRVAAALRRLPAGPRHAVQELDDGARIEVRIEISGGRAVIDFAGTSGVHPGNLNAPPAVTRSAVLYVLRLLLEDPLPLNEGLLDPIDLRLPPGMLNPSFEVDATACPAVVGGNVETSQRVVDTLLKAFGLVAGSQGTMNNVLFGNAEFGYYETVCGGTGAGPGWHGADAVHSHMTNTRITDPELLEHRYPVRLERFAVRRGSGGAGRWRGGDGAVREMTFLAPMSLSILSQHRRVGGYGMEGGEAGAPGRQRLIRHGGATQELAAVDEREVEAGDRLVLETPGGGGWGSVDSARSGGG